MMRLRIRNSEIGDGIIKEALFNEKNFITGNYLYDDSCSLGRRPAGKSGG